MKKQMEHYNNKIDELLRQDLSYQELENTAKDYHIHICFYQHERFIHLIVMITVALLSMMSIAIAIISDFLQMFLATFLLFTLLVPYIFHYMYLENKVQYMYEKYDEMLNRLKNSKS